MIKRRGFKMSFIKMAAALAVAVAAGDLRASVKVSDKVCQTVAQAADNTHRKLLSIADRKSPVHSC